MLDDFTKECHFTASRGSKLTKSLGDKSEILVTTVDSLEGLKTTRIEYAFNRIPNIRVAFKVSSDENDKILFFSTAIAQWIRLSLPSYRPGFEFQAHHLCFHQFIKNLCIVEKTKINKKRQRLAHLKKII